ncbi:unnamed protein product [Prorocentrum cordatum]|uniref:Tyr recombinase domain-containing protein n=1 Tax=Prorocentrum cordatum TaxID=2364126 RepID=A0ABN9QA17_9DINO|nr:unnamed protein product [Polarella glacialis]
MSGSSAEGSAQAAGGPEPEGRVRPRADVPAGAQLAAPRAELCSLLQRAAAIAGAGDDAQAVCDRLRLAGAAGADDFLGISIEEAELIWAPLTELSRATLSAFLGLCAVSACPVHARRAGGAGAAIVALRSQDMGRSQGSDPPVQRRSPRRGTVAAAAALRMCSAARSSGRPPPPDILADANAELARADCPVPRAPAQAPLAELKGLQARGATAADASDWATWVEFCGWKASAKQYASSVRPYGKTVAFCGGDACPPSQQVLDMFVSLFRSAATMAQYLSHVRCVLRWLQSDLGALQDTQRLVRGAEKAGVSKRRERIRATAEETRALARWCSRSGFADIGDSWIVSRQFCLRYGEALKLGSQGAPVRLIRERGLPDEIEVTFMQRKCFAEPVVVSRRCICRLQGKSLRGFCAISCRCAGALPGVIVPGLQHSEPFAVLKTAAQAIGLQSPDAWGTHAFRRGWATECLRANGTSALFCSGGWRGVTAFAYASATARSTVEAAEFLIDHSDSSAGE